MHGLGLAGGFVVILIGFGSKSVGFEDPQIPILFGLAVMIWSGIGLMVGGLPTGRYIETESDDHASPVPPRPVPKDFAERLRDLEGLRRDGLIDEEEYERKRDEILRERW